MSLSGEDKKRIEKELEEERYREQLRRAMDKEDKRQRGVLNNVKKWYGKNQKTFERGAELAKGLFLLTVCVTIVLIVFWSVSVLMRPFP